MTFASSIALRGALVLVRGYQHLEQQEGQAVEPDLVARGTRERLAPIVTTAAATLLALLPVMLFGGAAGLEILYPMAVVVLGGLVTATVLNLLIVPALYLRFGASPDRTRQGRSAGAAH